MVIGIISDDGIARTASAGLHTRRITSTSIRPFSQVFRCHGTQHASSQCQCYASRSIVIYNTLCYSSPADIAGCAAQQLCPGSSQCIPTAQGPSIVSLLEFISIQLAAAAGKGGAW